MEVRSLHGVAVDQREPSDARCCERERDLVADAAEPEHVRALEARLSRDVLRVISDGREHVEERELAFELALFIAMMFGDWMNRARPSSSRTRR